MIFVRPVSVQGAAASELCWITALDIIASCAIHNLKAATFASLRKRYPFPSLPSSIYHSFSVCFLPWTMISFTHHVFPFSYSMIPPFPLSWSPTFLVPSSFLCTDLFWTGLVACEPGKGSSIGHRLLDSTYGTTCDVPEAWITDLI